MSVLSRLGCVIVVAAGLCAALPAYAFLGGDYSSVTADRAHLAARLQTSAAATHTLHTLTLGNGGIVHEFSRSDGTVFAVTWRGPGRPDLRQLLGENFTTMQADNAVRRGRLRRMPLTVNRSNLVVLTGGHSGAFWGVAFLPHSAPAGFSTSELK